jgi:hypothetical protein
VEYWYQWWRAWLWVQLVNKRELPLI